MWPAGFQLSRCAEGARLHYERGVICSGCSMGPSHVQVPLSSRDHPDLCPLVLQVRTQLPGSLAEMMRERDVEVDPSTIMRWVHRYAPELEKRIRCIKAIVQPPGGVDETYVKVGGKWKYLIRAVDKHGPTDRLHADRPAKHASDLPFPWESADYDAALAAVLDHDRPARLVSESHHQAPARRQAGARHEASHLQVPEQHHRIKPRRAQACPPINARLSDDEDRRRYDRDAKWRTHAPPRASGDTLENWSAGRTSHRCGYRSRHGSPCKGKLARYIQVNEGDKREWIGASGSAKESSKSIAAQFTSLFD